MAGNFFIVNYLRSDLASRCVSNCWPLKQTPEVSAEIVIANVLEVGNKLLHQNILFTHTDSGFLFSEALVYVK